MFVNYHIVNRNYTHGLTYVWLALYIPLLAHVLFLFLLSSTTSLRSVCPFVQDVSPRSDAISFDQALSTLRDRLLLFLFALSTAARSIGQSRSVSLVMISAGWTLFAPRKNLGSGFVLLSVPWPLRNRHVSTHHLLLCHQAQWPLDSVGIFQGFGQCQKSKSITSLH